MAAADPHSILFRGTDINKSNFEPKRAHAKPKVARLRAGKVPDWAQEEEEEVERVVVRDGVADARLRRLQRASDRVQTDGPRTRRREITEAVVVQRSKPEAEVKKEVPDDGPVIREGASDDESEDEETKAANRRDRLREEALKRRQLEELKVKEEKLAEQQESTEEEESADEESEEESSEDEGPMGSTLLKPVFVPKTGRATIRERDAMEALEEVRAEEAHQKLKARARETKGLLVDHLKKEDELAAKGVLDNEVSDAEDLPDDDDDINEAEEYELWKIRELRRLKRDKEEREAPIKEQEEILRRRNMTDEQRAREDELINKLKPQKEKGKMMFMQKYYHRGAFFQEKAEGDQEHIYNRDYNAPVGEDARDKTNEAMPNAMKLRRGEWGMKGQTKHTHLMDVDTTDRTSAWSQKDNPHLAKTLDKGAGRKAANSFARPTKG